MSQPQKFKNKLCNYFIMIKELIMSAIIGVGSLMPVESLKAKEVFGSIEHIVSENKEKSSEELNLFYSLPGNIKGYTYIDFFKNGTYYGKTSLTRKINNKLGMKSQIVNSNNLFSRAGLGGYINIPFQSKNLSGNLSILPLWVNEKGNLMEDYLTAGYFISMKLPKEFKINFYGEWNVLAKGGPSWNYGEIEVEKNIGPICISYRPALIGKGDATPKLEQRVSIGFKFEF